MLNSATNSDGKRLWSAFAAPAQNGKWPWEAGKSLAWMLCLLLIAVAAAIAWAIPHFEQRLDASAKTDLAGAGIDISQLNLDWDYRNVTVTGVLPAGVTEAQIANTIRLTDGGGTRRILLDLSAPEPIAIAPPEPDEPEPVVTLPAPLPALDVVAESKDGTVDLVGTVLSSRQRDALVNAALAADGVVSINDNLEIVGDGQPDEISNTRLSVLADLLSHVGPSQVTYAQARLSDTELDYQIKANDRSSAVLIEEAVSVALVDFQVTGKIDYVKTGEIDVTARQQGELITLSGTVLSNDQRRRLLFAAEEATGVVSGIVDQLDVSQQEPRLSGADGRVEILASVISRFGSASSASARLHADTLIVQGEVADQQTLDKLTRIGEEARQQGVVTEENLVLSGQRAQRQAQAELQRKFDELALEIQRNVVFDSGTARLSPTATASLDKISAVIAQYPELLIEVEGHTDNRGRVAVNERLSEQRAQAVVSYLTGKSVSAERLQAVGYGDRRPLASNDTREGRRRNRRVQFTAVEEF